MSPIPAPFDPFAAVAGQERAVAALRSHLARTGGAGAVLIAGPEGVGRFLLAHRAACAILGTSPAALARAESLQHVDLTVLDPEAGIDGVRGAREALAQKPAEGPRQVLVVRDADRFSDEAHDALLKTLEEPPADAAILLVAEGAAFLPETVVSRCRLVRARALRPAETRAVLQRLGVPEETAADAEGSPGRAVYHHRERVAEAADALLSAMEGGERDPLGSVERLARPRGAERAAEQRRRLVETLQAAAARLRRRAPVPEDRLRAVVEGLGSLLDNGNAMIVLSDLVLRAWKPPARS